VTVGGRPYLGIMRKDSGFLGSEAPRHASRELDPAALLSALSQIDPSRLDEAGALQTITALERLKRGASAVQARLSVRVDEQARARQRKEGMRREQLGVGIGHQIALARMESPHRGGRDLGLAKALVSELPNTLASMERGDISEWRATIVGRETACLDPDTRRVIDERISDRLASWGDRETVREVRRLMYAKDPGAAVAQHAQAVSDRRVTIRPAPDTMCYLTALLPAVQGVAAYAALIRDAAQTRATGDPRGKGQVMADTLVERLTGQTAAPDVPVEVDLVMPLDTLVGDDHTPAHLVGYGPLPAAQARHLLRESNADAWVRRLFVRPESGQLVSMESRRRRFEGQLRHFVVLRDQFCRMPWCDAQIQHADHLVPHRGDGPTAHANGQGLCEACNYAKDAPGWDLRAKDVGGANLVAITTPTGNRYYSRAPDPPGTGPSLPASPWSPEAPGVWSIRARAG
jgi:5-methylcytosine-specific restriction endonuclease McrA